MKLRRCIDVFRKGQDKLVAELPLDAVPLNVLKGIFEADQSPDPEMIVDRRVEARHVPGLEKALGTQLDIDQFEYFVTCGTCAE